MSEYYTFVAHSFIILINQGKWCS